VEQVRYKRIRNLVRQFNRHRRLQSRKIDILCNDMIHAHAAFVERLAHLDFISDCYQRMLRCADVSTVVETAAEAVSAAMFGSNVAIFLLRRDGFDLHLADGDTPIELSSRGLESCFTPDTVKKISAAGKISRLDRDFAHEMGSDVLRDVVAFAVPLRRMGPPLGFVLVWRAKKDGVSDIELRKIEAVLPGLCNAITAIRARQKATRTG